MATCHLCPADDNTVSDGEILDHLRVLHPEQYGDGPQQWPDGKPVVHDMTLEPTEFNEGHPTPDASPDPLSEFAVQADRDGEMTLEHWPADPSTYCYWETEVKNGTTIPELAALAAAHLAEGHP